MLLVVKALVLILLTAMNTPSTADDIPPYLAKIYQLRGTVNNSPRRVVIGPGGESAKKPKRYKCILVDDEGETPVRNELGSRLDRLKAPSFVRELKIKASQNEEGERSWELTHSPVAYETTQPQQDTETLFYTQSPDALEDDKELAMPATTTAPVPRQSSSAKPLRQILLPRAHGIPLRRTMQESQDLSASNFEVASPSTTSLATAERNPDTEGLNAPLASNNQQLLLSPENCKMIEHYATIYGVKDIKSWVHHNCAFAKMYLPTASCAEIDVLVASCNFQPAQR